MTDLPPPPPPNMGPPPGYVAYGGSGAAPRSTQGIGGLAKALVVLLIIMIPTQILGVFSTISINNKAKDLLDGRISTSEFEDATQANLGSLGGLLVLPVAVLTIIWMYRMASNLRALGRNGTWAPGWAIGGWFVPPCVLYVVPWLMFKELWRGSDPDVRPGDPSWKNGPVSPLVTVWWVMYGLLPLVGVFTAASVVTQFTSSDADIRELAEQYDKFAAINLAMGVIAIGTTAVYLMLVRQLSARHMRATRETV